MIESAVLKALAERSGWDQYGEVFDDRFWPTQDHIALFQAIGSFWKRAGKQINQIDEPTLKAILDSREPGKADVVSRRLQLLRAARKVPQGKLDPLVNEALRGWAMRQALSDAAQDYTNGIARPADLAMKFDLLSKAMEIETDNGFNPGSDVRDIILHERSGQVFSTGLPSVDEQLEGGLWVGELGVILAKTYGGKTWGLTHLGSSALLRGIPVIHLTFELSGKRTAIRYYQAMLKRDRQKIITQYNKTQTDIRKLKLPPWAILDYSGGSVSTGKIRQVVMRFARSLDRRKYKSALIIVDYIDLVKSLSGGQEGYYSLTNITQELREIAVHFNMAMWSASQVVRTSYKHEIIRMEDIATAISKVEKADVVISFNANLEENMLGVMRWSIEKARERDMSAPLQYIRAVKAQQRFENRSLEEIEAILLGEGENVRD